MFGDPLTTVGWPPVYEGRVINVCDPADRACGGRGTSGHMTYGKTNLHKMAVEFIVDRFKNGVPAGYPKDNRATMKALPKAGDAANFLMPFVRWPPRDWATKYTDGWKAPTVGLK